MRDFVPGDLAMCLVGHVHVYTDAHYQHSYDYTLVCGELLEQELLMVIAVSDESLFVTTGLVTGWVHRVWIGDGPL